jgi:ligand-binding sensor domain-containing protein
MDRNVQTVTTLRSIGGGPSFRFAVSAGRSCRLFRRKIRIILWIFGGATLLLPAIADAAGAYQPRGGDPLQERWRWTHVVELDGKGLVCLTEGKDGSMWFGLQSGAIRYDGRKWTAYASKDGLFDAPVTSLCAARDGTIWAATSQIHPFNLCFFKDGKWKSLLSSGTNAKALPIGIGNIIEGADGSIWASMGMILQYKANEITLYGHRTNSSLAQTILPAARFVPLPDSATGDPFYVFEDQSGRIWVASRLGSVSCWNPQDGAAQDAKAWQNFDEACGLHAQWGPATSQTRDGLVWIGYGEGARTLRVYDPSSGQWSDSPRKIERVNRILETRDGTLWVASHSRLLARRDGSWRAYEGAELGISPGSLELFEASNGSLWLALRDGEVFHIDYSGQRWSSYEGLNFQAEGADGAEWFLGVDGSVVCHRAAQWTKYDVGDGLISAPLTLLCSKDGRTWVAGSHEGVAATAVFENGAWHRQLHSDLSWTIDFRSALETPDGRLWFAANNESIPGRQFSGGLVCCENSPGTTSRWTRLYPPQVPDSACGIAQTPDGTMYYGGWFVAEQSKSGWLRITNPSELGTYWIDAVAASSSGDVWASRGGIGLFRRHNGAWTKFDTTSGLPDLMVSTLLCGSDGTVWAATPKGISRFDGRSWTPRAFTTASIAVDRESGSLRESRDNRIWINSTPRQWYFRAKTGQSFDGTTLPGFRTIGYRSDRWAPETRLSVTFEKVSQPGNTLIAWEGSDPWGITPAGQLEFSHRLDSGEWSPYKADTQKMFLALGSGRHTFEVRARDLDFNVDPTPAQFQFVVVPPVWRQPWFLGLMGGFLVVLGAMEFRVIRRNYLLRTEVDERRRAQAAVEQQKKRVEEQNAELEAQKGQLVAHKEQLELEIDQRKAAEVLAEKARSQLMEASRKAGMAEIAGNILHSVGNELNSLTTSANTLEKLVRRSTAGNFMKLEELLRQHSGDLARFLTEDEKGKKLPGYVSLLAENLAQEQTALQEELAALREFIEHIQEVVAMQEQFARVRGITETTPLQEVIESAARLCRNAARVLGQAQGGADSHQPVEQRGPCLCGKRTRS